MVQSLCAAVLAVAVLFETVGLVQWSSPMQLLGHQRTAVTYVAQADQTQRY
jgi:hypothetical protein